MQFIPADQVIVGCGARVAFANEESGVNTDCLGTVTDRAPSLVDPEGFSYHDIVEVTWDDGEIDIMDRADLVLVAE